MLATGRDTATFRRPVPTAGPRRQAPGTPAALRARCGCSPGATRRGARCHTVNQGRQARASAPKQRTCAASSWLILAERPLHDYERGRQAWTGYDVQEVLTRTHASCRDLRVLCARSDAPRFRPAYARNARFVLGLATAARPKRGGDPHKDVQGATGGSVQA
jgi:hypothetical protein